MRQRSSLVLATGFAVAVSAGCTYALGPRALIGGHEYRHDRLPRLSRGMTEAEVRSLIGEPSARSTGRHGVTWRYRSVYQQRACAVLLFGIIPVEGRPKEQYEATLVFGAQGLEAARHVERLPGRTTTTNLLVAVPR